jgi:predicted RecB family nuclease
LEKIDAGFRFSATDLVGYLNCRHLSALDRAVAEGILAKPTSRDPLLQVLWDHGAIHEQNYVEHLKQKGLDPIRIDGVDVSEKAVVSTVDAMATGAAVIVQGALANNHSAGRADILRRVERPSVFGNWSYEVIDTKLARVSARSLKTFAGRARQAGCRRDRFPLDAAIGGACERLHGLAAAPLWAFGEP